RQPRARTHAPARPPDARRVLVRRLFRSSVAASLLTLASAAHDDVGARDLVLATRTDAIFSWILERKRFRPAVRGANRAFILVAEFLARFDGVLGQIFEGFLLGLSFACHRHAHRIGTRAFIRRRWWCG